MWEVTYFIETLPEKRDICEDRKKRGWVEVERGEEAERKIRGFLYSFILKHGSNYNPLSKYTKWNSLGIITWLDFTLSSVWVFCVTWGFLKKWPTQSFCAVFHTRPTSKDELQRRIVYGIFGSELFAFGSNHPNW